MPHPIISVCITTYNHEKFIEEAIDSVLAQKTNFDFEILIGEDDSQDKTREIVKRYQQRYPNKIRLFLNSRDDVIYIDGRPTGRWNLINNLKNAKGKYIALLDGDDYWIDNSKLQRQVDFMEQHPDHTICFHEVLAIDEISSPPSKSKFPDFTPVLNIESLIRQNFIATSSVVYRNIFQGKLPHSFEQVPMGDWPLHIMHASLGKIAQIEGVYSVYRIHSAGIWHGTRTSRERQFQSLFGFYHFLKKEFKDTHTICSVANELYKYNLLHLLGLHIATRKWAQFLKAAFNDKQNLSTIFSKAFLFTSIVSFRKRQVCYIDSWKKFCNHSAHNQKNKKIS